MRCNEQRFPWQWSAAPAARRAQWDAAFASLAPGSFGPFSPCTVSGDPREPALPACTGAHPPRPSPRVPDGASYPAVPALVIGRDLDGAVPAVARAYADRFLAGFRYVEQEILVPY